MGPQMLNQFIFVFKHFVAQNACEVSHIWIKCLVFTDVSFSGTKLLSHIDGKTNHLSFSCIDAETYQLSFSLDLRPSNSYLITTHFFQSIDTIFFQLKLPRGVSK